MEYPKKWQNIDAMGDKTCQIICQTEIARGKHLVHMFPPYIFTMSRSTPDQKSRREVRRRLVDLYSSNLLSMSANLPSPDHLLWPLTAVPHAGAMKELLFHYFRTFIRKRVQAMVDWCLGFCLVQCLLLFFSPNHAASKVLQFKVMLQANSTTSIAFSGKWSSTARGCGSTETSTSQHGWQNSRPYLPGWTQELEKENLIKGSFLERLRVTDGFSIASDHSVRSSLASEIHYSQRS